MGPAFAVQDPPVPGDARHAFANRSREPAVTLVVTTNRLCRFFQETGTLVAPGGAPTGPPSAEAVELLRHRSTCCVSGRRAVMEALR